jgi:acylphosphatase
LIKAYQIIIYGKVQGVGFRANAHAFAIKNNLLGFVKNLPNNTVFIHAEGNEENINRLIEWCYVGPRLAKVKEVQATEVQAVYYKTFELRR